MSAVGRVLDAVYLVGAWLAGLLLVTLCALVLWSSLARQIGVYAGGVNDFAGYVMATSTFLGMAYAFRSGAMIRVALLVDHLSGPARRIVQTLCLAVLAAVAVYLAYFLILLVLDSYEYGERSEGADAILLWIPQTPVAIGATLFALAGVHSFFEALFAYSAFEARQAGLEEPNEV